MSTTEIIKELCRNKGITIAQLERDLGFSNGSLSKTDYLRADRAYKVAEFFNVSIEYLLTGRVPEIPETVDPDSLELLELFNRLNNTQKDAIMIFLRSFAS